MEVANASLLDEATAAAEAMTLLHRVSTKKPDGGGARPVSGQRSLFPADASKSSRSRAEPLGIELHVGPLDQMPLDGRAYGALLQYPDECGLLQDLAPFITSAHDNGVARRRGRRPAGAGDRHAARRDGRRRRLRQLAAIRRAARLRRAARGVLRHAAGLRPPDAGPHHRRLGRRRTATRRTAWRWRRASSTSGARRRPRTSAPRRRCWPTWRRCTPCITGLTA